MIRSMTGFGKAQAEINSKQLSVQIKSLNSKQFDFYLRAPAVYKEKELDIRSLLISVADRGKFELTIQLDSNKEEGSLEFNKELFKLYYNELKTVAVELNETTDILPIISRFPEVLKSREEKLDEEEWSKVMTLVSESLSNLDEFRIQEGAVLESDFHKRIELIRGHLEQAVEMEGDRMDIIRSRIDKNLRALVDSDKINQDRFEQELIYYLEKVDFTEEKTRLLAHCDYFLETMQSESSQGKKLGFISQEIGREINTIGSKANHAGIQKLVVQMKDELEKIKEQLLNVL